MTERPKLYPGHQHQWTVDHHPGCDYLDYGMSAPGSCTCSPLVRCTVCGLQMPRNVARLDGTPAVSDQSSLNPSFDPRDQP